MQVFVPYPEPIKVAQCLDAKRLNKQIIECRQILDAIDGTGKGWFNHPVVKMYKPYRDWLFYYMNCLDCYQKGLINYAQDWDEWANEKNRSSSLPIYATNINAVSIPRIPNTINSLLNMVEVKKIGIL